LHEAADAGQKDAETQAHRFASTFLMPKDSIREHLPSRPDFDRLLELKHEWQVSMAALLRRASDLDVMSPAAYTQANKIISIRKWRVNEPGNLGPPEQPALLSCAVQVAEENGITLQDLADRHGLPLVDLRAILRPSMNLRPAVRL